MASIRLPDAYMKRLPNIFGITRKDGKTTLVCAATHEEALGKYNTMVSQLPHIGWSSASPDAVCTVQAVQ